MAKIYKFIFFLNLSLRCFNIFIATFFPAWFITCTSRHSRRRLVYLACLLSHVLRAYCNFESKQAISISLFGRGPNNNVFPMRINGVCVAVQFYILGLNFLYFCFGNGNE